MLAGSPWRGAALRVSVCTEAPEAVAGVLFRSAAGPIAVVTGASGALPDLPGVTVERARGPALVPGQWYRLDAERWGWSTRLAIDGQEVCRVDGLSDAEAGSLALLVAGGPAVFDDAQVDEIPWLADDGRDFRLAWVAASGAQWYRPRRVGAGWCLAGRKGTLHAATADWSPAEILVEGSAASVAMGLRIPGFASQPVNGRVAFAASAEGPRAVEMVADRPCRIGRLVVRGPSPDPGEGFYHLGVYHFSEANVPDIADYLDFTPAEYQAIAASPDAERLRRHAKEFEVVGSSSDYAIWATESGHWGVRDGVLRGAGGDAAARFWQALNGAYRVQLRVRLGAADSAVRLVLGETAGAGTVVRLAGPAAAGPVGGAYGATVSAAEWHGLEADFSEQGLNWSVDGGEARQETVARGIGGGVLLRVERGSAEFDDVLFAVPRRVDLAPGCSRFYAFDRREADWWRRGPWTDHGGIACAVASSWISLEAPAEEGWLVHKQTFATDLLVALNVEESTEWHGWDREPSHTHRPADNVSIMLACNRDLRAGYRLEVNSRDRRLTVLSRNGAEVASVVQDGSFPITYVGGHAPYRPRRNRICLVRQGDELGAVINGVEVLRYRDPEPLATPTIAVGGHHTHFNISNLQVRELPPQPAPPPGR